MRTVDEWKGALRNALKEALLARQEHAVRVMRETLAAIDNAEATDLSAAPKVQHGVIAGGVVGLHAGEVPRRSLSPEAVASIVESELHERRAAMETYLALGRSDEAEILKLQIELLASLK